MIQIEQLTKRFGRATAANDISLTIARGESVALWGVNGAGKSTLIRCVLGLLPYIGHISVCDMDARKCGKQVRQLIGYVPQELGFYDDLRVHEAVGFFARIKGHRIRDVETVLTQVGLPGQARKRIRDLSGGMKQRLALAIALLGDPPILVLDEVTASLDACGRDEFVSLLANLARSDQRAMLFASHRPEEIQALASRVVTLEAGRKISDQPTNQWLQARRESTQLHLMMHPSQCASAIDLLRKGGFPARMNGRGILVDAPPGRRVQSLQMLTEARIGVDDFEIIATSQSYTGGAR